MPPSIYSILRMKPLLSKGDAMDALIGRLGRDERAQDLAEYGIALAIIAGFVVAVTVAIATNVQTLWSNAQQNVASVASAEH